MRNHFSFSCVCVCGGGGERLKGQRERENLWEKNPFFLNIAWEKRQCSDLFQPQSKDLEFLTIARFFFNFAGMRLKDRLGFFLREKMVVTTISFFFQTYFGIYKAKSHNLHLSPANALNAKIRWTFYTVSQPSFLS